MDNFRAREGEDVSLWLLSDEPVERQRVLAAFAAARNKLQPLSFLELQQEWLDECQIQPRQIHDPAALDCVRRFHYEMREPDAETLKLLAVEIQAALLETPQLFRRLNRTDTRGLLRHAHDTCRGPEGVTQYDTAALPEWATELLP